MIPAIDRRVHIIAESLWRSKLRYTRSFDSMGEHFISIEQLCKTMDSGEPGTYVVVGI